MDVQYWLFLSVCSWLPAVLLARPTSVNKRLKKYVPVECEFPVKVWMLVSQHVCLSSISCVTDESVGKLTRSCWGLRVFCGSWCVWASRLEKRITSVRMRTDGKRRRKGTIMCSSCWSPGKSGTTRATNAIWWGYKLWIDTHVSS